jgi:hypothetical protein
MLYFISGAFSSESVIHEFLHHIVHPTIEAHKSEIIKSNLPQIDIDKSYFVNGDDNGKINAFEEYLVRELTKSVLNGARPSELDSFLASRL